MFQAIIFDLGGVIEKINPSAVAQAFKELGMLNPESFFSLFRQSELCTAFELGYLHEKKFIDHLKSMCPHYISSDQIIAAWCMNQNGISRQTLVELDKLKSKGVKLFILSNTNPIHARKVEEAFSMTHKREFRSVFDKLYYSFEVHMRKPEETIYRYLLTHENLLPKTCIYVDDLEMNLKVPTELGLYCVHHPINSEIDSHSLDTLVCTSG